MESRECQGRQSKKLMRPVMVGLQLLIVNIYVLQEETVKNTTEGWTENSSEKICEWFKEEQFLEILRRLKPVLMKKINSPPPINSKQNYQSKELKSVRNIAVSYIFKKRPNISGQYLVLRQSDSIYCSCGKKIAKDNVKYESFPIFRETLEISVKRSVLVEPGNELSESVPYHKPMEEMPKESKSKEDGTSSYFTEPPHCLQRSSVKRKKTMLRKMAKKSRIALNELPSYQSITSHVVVQEQCEEDTETMSLQEVSSGRNRCRPAGNKSNKTLSTRVIDLEKEPEGLKDIREVEDLRDDHLKFLIDRMEGYLRTIFRGEVFCRRHEDYKKGGKNRDNLNFQVGMAHFSEEQHECILSCLVAMFCYKDKKYLDYVIKVMLPEALIKMYQDIHKTSFEEAEECLFNDTIRDN